ncbi:unnamed protein product [Moneuplotes crassus]|uniref:BRCT domain-containing protein n=1 Tax=Euplotes crassus TaxID=5936 RepID=A0AAD1U182_EUPCR|nr:unnamed protein product [Moneuplotes crassus]
MNDARVVVNDIGSTIQELMDIEEVVTEKITKAITRLEEIRSKFNQDQQDIKVDVNIKKILLKTSSANKPSFQLEEAKEPQAKEIIEITSDSSEELTLVKQEAAKKLVKHEDQSCSLNPESLHGQPETASQQQDDIDLCVELSDKPARSLRDSCNESCASEEKSQPIDDINISPHKVLSNPMKISEVNEIGSHTFFNNFNAFRSESPSDKTKNTSLMEETKANEYSGPATTPNLSKKGGKSSKEKVKSSRTSFPCNEVLDKQADKGKKTTPNVASPAAPKLVGLGAIEEPQVQKHFSSITQEVAKDEEIRIDPNLLHALIGDTEPSLQKKKYYKKKRPSNKRNNPPSSEKPNESANSPTDTSKEEQKSQSKGKNSKSTEATRNVYLRRNEKFTRNQMRFYDQQELHKAVTSTQKVKKKARTKNHICFSNLDKSELETLHRFSWVFRYEISQNYDPELTDYLVVRDNALKENFVGKNFYKALCDHVPIIKFGWIAESVKNLRRAAYGKYKVFQTRERAQAMLNHMIFTNSSLPNPFTVNKLNE